jgi:hypothetical protein
MRKLYLVIVMLLLSLAAPLSAQRPIVEPTDRPVALAGTMKMVHAYGPPGYGEDPKKDVKVSYLALGLAFSVTTICTPQMPQLQEIQCGATDTLRLVFPTNKEAVTLKKRALALVGKRVLVTGVLHRQESMSDYTHVYMDVAEVSAIRPEADSEKPK